MQRRVPQPSHPADSTRTQIAPLLSSAGDWALLGNDSFHDFNGWPSWPERMDQFRHAPDAQLLACLDSIVADAIRRSPPDNVVIAAAQGARDCLTDDGTRDLVELDAIFAAEAEWDDFIAWQGRATALGAREMLRREYCDLRD